MVASENSFALSRKCFVDGVFDSSERKVFQKKAKNKKNKTNKQTKIFWLVPSITDWSNLNVEWDKKQAKTNDKNTKKE
jgi:hypothetical protein